MRHLCTTKPHVDFDAGRFCINIDLPRTWSDLSEDQLRYILQLKASDTMSPAEIRACALMRFNNMEERRPKNDEEIEMNKHGYHFFRSDGYDLDLPEWFLISAVDAISFIDHPTGDVTRLEHAVNGYRPCSATFNDLPFGEYLQIESLWQSAMATQSEGDGSRDISDTLFEIAEILYKPIVWWHLDVHGLDLHIKLPRRKSLNVDDVMTQNVLHWMNGFHIFAQETWPHLFRSGSGTTDVTRESLKEQIDVQIQALSGGDVTKVEAVMNVDTWTALNMLDIKQKDAEMARKEAERREREIKSRKR